MKCIFESITVKLTRAEQHLYDFHLRLQAFYSSNPYEVVAYDDMQAGKRTHYLDKVDDVPLALATIASDVTQNLRSALDHTASQLVLKARGGMEPNWNVYFPIARLSSDYPGLRRRYIKGVGQAVVDAIDATEPYEGGEGHGLWQLHEVNRADKHRLLVAAGSAYTGFHLRDVFDSHIRSLPGCENLQMPDYIMQHANRQMPLGVGNALLIEPIPELHEDRRFAFEVALNVPGVVDGEPAIKVLKDLSDLVSRVVRTFEPFL